MARIITVTSTDRTQPKWKVRWKSNWLLVLLVLSSAVCYSVAPVTVSAEQTTPEAVVRVLQPELNTYWGGLIRKWGYVYRAPNVIWYNTTRRPGRYLALYCGWQEVNNSSYCPETNTIFLDHGLARWALSEYGDYAVGFMLIHEHAHAVQEFVGTGRRYDMGRISQWQFEVQADCYGGVFTHHIASVGLLEEGDLDEALDLARWAGVTRSSRNTHGDKFERPLWFLKGYYSGTTSKCNP